MKKTDVYTLKNLYRDDFRVSGFTFGSGEKALCVIGSMRGNENQQLFACSLLVNRLKSLEEEGKFEKGKEILVIPCANPESMNIRERFWPIDSTDINRMFPGYDKGETTQRVADGIFKAVKQYNVGIQFASFYMRGSFAPHVRMMKTGFENVEMAREFGMPYIIIREPRPFDTTTLNYNWQIWNVNAFSIYTTDTENIDRESAENSVNAIIRFMEGEGLIKKSERGKDPAEVRKNSDNLCQVFNENLTCSVGPSPKANSNGPMFQGLCQVFNENLTRVVYDEDLVTVRSTRAGFFESNIVPGQPVEAEQELARIYDPTDHTVRSIINAPCGGTVLFRHTDNMAYADVAVFKIVKD